MYYAINMKGNSKTAIPTTTSSKATCPDTCPLKEKGCYAKYSFLGKYWKDLSEGNVKNSLSFDELLDKIKAMPEGQAWRHNQAGDLPHIEGDIYIDLAFDLVKANKGKRGFTYTHHKPTLYNKSVIDLMNENGFTVNLSANSLEQADKYVAQSSAPVVTVLPIDSEKVVYTPAGHKVVVCPATHSKVTCKECMLCQKADRDYIIGFPAHGAAKKQVEIIARG